jgi:hypothetical protein
MNRAMFRPRRPVFAGLEAAVFAGALGAWEWLTRTPLNMRTALTLAGLYGVLGILREKQNACDEAGVESSPPEKEKQRVFVKDPEVVLELAKLAGYEAVRRFTPYLGKWTTISGSYEGIAKSFNRDSIHLTLVLNDGRRVNLKFGLEQGERLRELKEGQQISAICQIQHASLTFTPENCELIRAEPLRGAGRRKLAYVS